MAQEIKHFMNETDIGSGEKNPTQEEIEQDQQVISTTNAGRILRHGTHLARILAVKQADDIYEAQVYVRLTREPEVAETYIPAGTFVTEAEAWSAAEERANRAFKEHEF